MTRVKTLHLPSLTHTTIGFDRLFDELMQGTNAGFPNSSYPPYNIVELSETEWQVSLAVSGFSMDNLEITLEKDRLVVAGTAPSAPEDVKYIYRGLAGRSFRREFKLAEYVEVESAELDLGILNIRLKKNVPEVMLPEKIQINSNN